MKLTKRQEQAIYKEFEAFKDRMYADKTMAEREELEQFFTPADMTIDMLKALNCTYQEFINSDILDPTSGSGNLLAAALIIGADPLHVFGNEYDSTMVDICRKRLQKINPKVQDWQVHQGNALIPDCLTEFGPDYNGTVLDILLTPRRDNKNSDSYNDITYTLLEQPDEEQYLYEKQRRAEKAIAPDVSKLF